MKRKLPDPRSASHFKSDHAQQRAKRLRRETTAAEKLLWRALRGGDAHWRKQVAIGPFVADFVCHGSRLIVEADGGAHRAPDVALRDAQRDAWLNARGYRVLRFANAEIERDLERVLAQIDLEVRAPLLPPRADTPTPNPSPQGGGEESL